MAKTKEGVNGIIEKLALVSENVGDMFPNGKSVVVYSLNKSDFDLVKTQINDFSSNNQFKIDISGIEFIFLRDELLNTVTNKS